MCACTIKFIILPLSGLYGAENKNVVLSQENLAQCRSRSRRNRTRMRKNNIAYISITDSVCRQVLKFFYRAPKDVRFVQARVMAVKGRLSECMTVSRENFFTTVIDIGTNQKARAKRW